MTAAVAVLRDVPGDGIVYVPTVQTRGLHLLKNLRPDPRTHVSPSRRAGMSDTEEGPQFFPGHSMPQLAAFALRCPAFAVLGRWGRAQRDAACEGCGYGLGIGDPVFLVAAGPTVCAPACLLTDLTWPD